MNPKLSHNPHNRAILLRLIGELDDELVTQILEKGKALELDTGAFLFHQKDKDNSLYTVLSGRFRALAEQSDDYVREENEKLC